MLFDFFLLCGWAIFSLSTCLFCRKKKIRKVYRYLSSSNSYWNFRKLQITTKPWRYSIWIIVLKKIGSLFNIGLGRPGIVFKPDIFAQSTKRRKRCKNTSFSEHVERIHFLLASWRSLKKRTWSAKMSRIRNPTVYEKDWLFPVKLPPLLCAVWWAISLNIIFSSSCTNFSVPLAAHIHTLRWGGGTAPLKFFYCSKNSY